jgi:ABC-type Na+ efflux pump permease subunit
MDSNAAILSANNNRNHIIQLVQSIYGIQIFYGTRHIGFACNINRFVFSRHEYCKRKRNWNYRADQRYACQKTSFHFRKAHSVLDSRHAHSHHRKPTGSFFTIYVFAAVYLLAVLGLGLLLSTYCSTQQQAMLLSFFLIMIFILLGGLYTPIESMPVWAQWITKFNPVTYFIQVMRDVVLKGSTLKDIAPNIGIIFLFAVALNSWAVVNYRKRG